MTTPTRLWTSESVGRESEKEREATRDAGREDGKQGGDKAEILQEERWVRPETVRRKEVDKPIE